MSTQSFRVSKYLTDKDLWPYSPAVPTFGENLSRLRLAKGLTQKQLADAMKLKSNTPISLWEKSNSLPRPATVIRAAKALNCTTADLLEGVQFPYDSLRGASDPAPSRGSPAEQRPAKRKRTG